jgi:hypothetical protein
MNGVAAVTRRLIGWIAGGGVANAALATPSGTSQRSVDMVKKAFENQNDGARQAHLQ